MTKLPVCLLLLIAPAMFAAEPGLRLTIPRSAHAPVLDGKLASGEWDDAAAVTGIINQLDGVAHPRQATFWLKYDDKNIYIAQRSSMLPGEKNAPPITLPFGNVSGMAFAFNRLNVAEVMPPLYFKDNQNVVTIALAPNRVNSGDTPSHYRFMANIATTQPVRRELCDQIMGVKFNSISSPGDSLADQPNNAKSFNSFNADATIWESEYAIPLAEMKVEKAPAGEEWGILLARDYPQQDQNAIVQTTSYRFDYLARDWRNLAVMNAYHQEKEYARARLVENEPIVQALELGDLLAGHIKAKFAFSNPTAQPTSVTVKLDVGTKTQQQTIALAGGERKEWTSAEEIAAGDATQNLTILVSNAAGKSLYQQTLPFRAGYGRDRTTLVPDMWLSGEPKGCAGAVCWMSVYNPIRNTLWAKLVLAGRPSEKSRARAEISVRRAGEDKPFATYPMSSDVKGIGDYQAKTVLPDLKPGVYEATANLFDKENNLLARSRELFIRYDHAKELPWLNNKVGINDKVYAPWTPIVANTTTTGVDLACWGRTYKIDGSGLPQQVTTLEKDVLSAPIHFEMTRDGKPVALTPAPQVSDVHTAAHEVNYVGSLTGDGWKINTSAHLEYDGYLLYHIRLEPQGPNQKVDRIKLVVPLTSEDGRYLHVASCFMGDMRGAHSTEKLKPEKGRLWDSTQQAGGPWREGLGLTVGTFKPYVWVGGVKRGVAFMADNDKDWVPDESEKAPAIEVVRTDAGVEMVLNIVARPFTFDHAREITFSLQATPVKPLTDDFRQARNQLNMGTAFVGGDPDGWSWDGCQLRLRNSTFHYLGGNGTAPFPLNWEKNKKWINSDRKDRWPVSNPPQVVTKYMAMNAHFHYPEVDDPRVPGLQGANWYGYLTPEITGHRDIGDASMSHTEVDFRIWYYARWIKENGLQGFYFDNSFTGYSANPDAGLGYVIDLHDRPNINGYIQPGFAWTGIRDLLKRLHSVIADEGHRPYLWLHATDTFAISAYSFADFLLDGETLPYITPKNPWFSEKWSPDYMQVINDSSKWGLGIDMLDLINEFSGGNDVGAARLTFRDYAGYLMLYDNEGMTWRYGDWSGLDLSRRADFLPYWDPAVAPALVTGNEKVFASAWRQDNVLRIEIFNRSGVVQKNLKLRIDPKALGIVPASGKTLVVKDLEQGVPKESMNWPGDVGMSSHIDGEFIDVTLDILPHDYRLLRVE